MKKLVILSIPMVLAAACEQRGPVEPRERAAERIEQQAEQRQQALEQRAERIGERGEQRAEQIRERGELQQGAAGAQQPVGAQQPGVMGQQQPVGAQQPGMMGQQQPVGAQQPGMMGQQQPVGAQQPGMGAQQQAGVAQNRLLYEAATAIQNDPQIPQEVKRGLQIGVQEDKIIIRGTVPDERTKELIEQRVRRIGEVENQLQVQGEAR